MVLVLLNNFQFEAEKFETRTMPTPNMKGKEMIYWIRVSTYDKRLATELQRFLDGAPKFIDLKVPSAFITAKTELESKQVFAPKDLSQPDDVRQRGVVKAKAQGDKDTVEEVANSDVSKDSSATSEQFRLEIVLRRTLLDTPEKQTQSPYG
jgi:hypothetical protein